MASFQDNDIICDTYSFAGKQSLRKYNVNLKGKTKKVNKNILFANSYIFSLHKVEDSLHINPYSNKKKFDLEKIDFLNKTYKEKNKNLFQSDNYKYHKRNQKIFELKRSKIDIIKGNPILYEVNNNNDKPKKIRYILNWRKLTGRKPIDKEKENLYKNYSDINIKTDNYKQLGFVDMSKQTQRDDNFLTGDLRNRSGKKYIEINFKEEKEKWNQFCKKPLKAKSPFSSDMENIFFKRKLLLSSKNKTKKIKKFFASQIDKKIMNLSSYKQKSVIDFKKTSGRQNLFKDQVLRNSTPRVDLHPNYSSIEERVKMMVVYKNKQEKNDSNEIRKGNWEEYYSTTESYEKIYGHKLKSVPNFKQMMSRTNSNNLPTFMNGIHNRMYEYNLEMNLMNNYFTERNENDKIKKINKVKDFGNKRPKSKEILNKFINLYADTFYNSKKNKKNILKNKI